jgi:hypothetical protein
MSTSENHLPPPNEQLVSDPLVRAWLDPANRLYDSAGDVALLQNYLAAPDDHLRELLARRLQDRQAERIMADDPYYGSYPPKGSELTTEPALCLGYMPTDDPLPLPTERLAAGICFQGPTGTAKTTLLQWLIYQLAHE